MNGLKKQSQVDGYKRVTFEFKTNTAPGWRLSTAVAALGIKKYANVTIIIYPGVDVGGMIIDMPAPKSKVKLINNGRIIGQASGGDGLVITHPVKITNNGTIAGAGGAGGAGGDGFHGGLTIGWTTVQNYICLWYPLAGGGGGNGAGMSGTSYVNLTYGVGGIAATDAASRAGVGGAGGALGQPGTSGTTGWRGNSWYGGSFVGDDGVEFYCPPCGVYDEGPYQAGAPGGAPGRAVSGNNFVVWLTVGTIIGALV